MQRTTAAIAALFLSTASSLSPRPMFFAAVTSNAADCGAWRVTETAAGLTITQRAAPSLPLVVRDCDPFPAAQVILHETGDTCGSYTNTSSAQLAVAQWPDFCLGVREASGGVGVYKCDDASAARKWEYKDDDGTVWARAGDGTGVAACLVTRTWAHTAANYSSSRAK